MTSRYHRQEDHGLPRVLPSTTGIMEPHDARRIRENHGTDNQVTNSDLSDTGSDGSSCQSVLTRKRKAPGIFAGPLLAGAVADQSASAIKLVLMGDMKLLMAYQEHAPNATAIGLYHERQAGGVIMHPTHPSCGYRYTDTASYLEWASNQHLSQFVEVVDEPSEPGASNGDRFFLDFGITTIYLPTLQKS
ncbi:hypothetical protein PG991_010384 [Apiospora marii]|uniref:Uncharacterized protein n=1 Tax=Apiospora marii TaxID=335849 RepID=A0ABR1RKE0_9PEZI